MPHASDTDDGSPATELNTVKLRLARQSVDVKVLAGAGPLNADGKPRTGNILEDSIDHDHENYVDDSVLSQRRQTYCTVYDYVNLSLDRLGSSATEKELVFWRNAAKLYDVDM